MKTIARGAASALLALGLAGGFLPGAHAQWHNTSTQDTELSRRTKKLGILVVAGYRAHVVKRGTLMNIGKVGQFVPVDDPKVADAIFEAVTAQVRQEERYEISRVPVEPAAARNIAGTIIEKYGYRKAWETLLTPFYDACACDALLLVTDGPSENPFSETQASYGPSFSSKAAVSNSGAPIKSHVRLGLLLMLADPLEKDIVRQTQLSDVPDYSDDVAKHWPGSETEVAQEYWNRLAAYVGTPGKTYQRALFWVGLRPSCALPFYNNSSFAQQRNQQPPQTLPGTDPSKCPITP